MRPFDLELLLPFVFFRCYKDLGFGSPVKQIPLVICQTEESIYIHSISVMKLILNVLDFC